jgi:hypothetical protein
VWPSSAASVLLLLLLQVSLPPLPMLPEQASLGRCQRRCGQQQAEQQPGE